MSDLCGIWTRNPAERSETVRTAGLRLRPQGSNRAWSQTTRQSLTIGFWEFDSPGLELPGSSSDQRYELWLLGEAFEGPAAVPPFAPSQSRTQAFRASLLEWLIKTNWSELASLDGEFILIVWDNLKQEVIIANDRFGAIPLYWVAQDDCLMFATGVRALLSMPGVSADPDVQALREAVTFGGYRLGSRTNIRSVSMLPPGSVLKSGASQPSRYWHWRDIPKNNSNPPVEEVVDGIHARWQRSIKLRLDGSARPGQTLSGGLDSRAILAEAAPLAPRWTAITFGLPGCDDEKYARMAAARVRADWLFHPLYSGLSPDWLDLRSSFIQMTDGLIDLHDLMHLETLPQQRALLDCHISGYIGDVVSGPSYADIQTARDALYKLPYYETPLGLGFQKADEFIAELHERGNKGASASYLIFEHKFPQSTSRWSSSWRPFFRVRRPFTSYAFFDFCHGLPAYYRTTLQVHERWLLAKYPALFAGIPNQKTGLPILSSKSRLQLERARRYATRKAYPLLKKLNPGLQPRERNFSADDVVWRSPGVVERITSTVLRPGSIACETFGRDTVKTFLDRWVSAADAPAQVIGALYVYEAYHRDLKSFLANS